VLRALRHGAALVALVTAFSAYAASGFFVLSAGTELRDGVYRLSAHVRYELSEDVERAIRNGIPVDLRLDIEILRPRAFVWSETVAELQQLYRVQFHALSRRYVATNINSGEQSDFDTLSEALVSLSEVADLPLIDRGLLEPDESHVVRVRADVDYGVLPVPLRYYAIALPSWRLTSEWYNFPLQ
jgi:hypothetical protein